MIHANTMVSTRSLLERALDALPDGVLLTNAVRQVLYANAAFGRHWNIPSELLASKDESRMLQHVQRQLLDAGAFLREVERITPTSETSQDEVHLKDGRVFSRRSVPFEEDGHFAARIWIFTDVTEARHARLDALCGIPNRRAYSSDFPTFAEAADDGLIRSVALMDIDNFKKYNDHYGHAAGDVVLRRIGALLRQRFSNDDDMAFRIGGEEFLLACKSREKSDAFGLFAALRDAIEALTIPHVGNPPHNVVTASFGLAQFEGPLNPGGIFKAVDAALYRAKAGGRNKISVAAGVRDAGGFGPERRRVKPNIP